MAFPQDHQDGHRIDPALLLIKYIIGSNIAYGRA